MTPAAKSLFVESNDRPYGLPGKILTEWAKWTGIQKRDRDVNDLHLNGFLNGDSADFLGTQT